MATSSGHKFLEEPLRARRCGPSRQCKVTAEGSHASSVPQFVRGRANDGEWHRKKVRTKNNRKKNKLTERMNLDLTKHYCTTCSHVR